MSQRLIPNSDSEFSDRAMRLAQQIGKEPERFAVTAKDAAAMLDAAQRFVAAFREARSGGGRSVVATRAKDDARAEAARVYKRCVDLIRVGEHVDGPILLSLGLRPRSE